MKRYEAPMVELTKFDVKDDILATSGISVIDSTNPVSDEIKNQIVTTVQGESNDAVGVFTW